MPSSSLHYEIAAAALLCGSIAAATDLRDRRIPNLLTGPAMLLGLLLHALAGGWRELASSLAALLLCGFVFLLFHLAGGMGAGDVKLIAAEGCLLGLPLAPSLLAFTAIVGGILALGMAAFNGRLRETLSNVLSLVQHHRDHGLHPHPELNVRNAGTLRLPYALAIAAGVAFTLYTQSFQG